jgi:putative oxidoreductase
MMPSKRAHDYYVPAITLVLAAVFVYAGAEKVGDSLQFADTIAAFAILPATLTNPLALSLPLFEIACGLLLLVRRTRRIGALAVILLCMVFFSALF